MSKPSGDEGASGIELGNLLYLFIFFLGNLL